MAEYQRVVDYTNALSEYYRVLKLRIKEYKLAYHKLLSHTETLYNAADKSEEYVDFMASMKSYRISYYQVISIVRFGRFCNFSPTSKCHNEEIFVEVNEDIDKDEISYETHDDENGLIRAEPDLLDAIGKCNRFHYFILYLMELPIEDHVEIKSSETVTNDGGQKQKFDFFVVFRVLRSLLFNLISIMQRQPYENEVCFLRENDSITNLLDDYEPIDQRMMKANCEISPRIDHLERTYELIKQTWLQYRQAYDCLIEAVKKSRTEVPKAPPSSFWSLKRSEFSEAVKQFRIACCHVFSFVHRFDFEGYLLQHPTSNEIHSEIQKEIEKVGKNRRLVMGNVAHESIKMINEYKSAYAHLITQFFKNQLPGDTVCETYLTLDGMSVAMKRLRLAHFSLILFCQILSKKTHVVVAAYLSNLKDVDRVIVKDILDNTINNCESLLALSVEKVNLVNKITAATRKYGEAIDNALALLQNRELQDCKCKVTCEFENDAILDFDCDHTKVVNKLKETHYYLMNTRHSSDLSTLLPHDSSINEIILEIKHQIRKKKSSPLVKNLKANDRKPTDLQSKAGNQRIDTDFVSAVEEYHFACRNLMKFVGAMDDTTKGAGLQILTMDGCIEFECIHVVNQTRQTFFRLLGARLSTDTRILSKFPKSKDFVSEIQEQLENENNSYTKLNLTRNTLASFLPTANNTSSSKSYMELLRNNSETLVNIICTKTPQNSMIGFMSDVMTNQSSKHNYAQDLIRTCLSRRASALSETNIFNHLFDNQFVPSANDSTNGNSNNSNGESCRNKRMQDLENRCFGSCKKNVQVICGNEITDKTYSVQNVNRQLTKQSLTICENSQTALFNHDMELQQPSLTLFRSRIKNNSNGKDTTNDFTFKAMELFNKKVNSYISQSGSKPELNNHKNVEDNIDHLDVPTSSCHDKSMRSELTFISTKMNEVEEQKQVHDNSNEGEQKLTNPSHTLTTSVAQNSQLHSGKCKDSPDGDVNERSHVKQRHRSIGVQSTEIGDNIQEFKITPYCDNVEAKFSCPCSVPKSTQTRMKKVETVDSLTAVCDRTTHNLTRQDDIKVELMNAVNQFSAKLLEYIQTTPSSAQVNVETKSVSCNFDKLTLKSNVEKIHEISNSNDGRQYQNEDTACVKGECPRFTDQLTVMETVDRQPTLEYLRKHVPNDDFLESQIVDRNYEISGDEREENDSRSVLPKNKIIKPAAQLKEYLGTGRSKGIMDCENKRCLDCRTMADDLPFFQQKFPNREVEMSELQNFSKHTSKDAKKATVRTGKHSQKHSILI